MKWLLVLAACGGAAAKPSPVLENRGGVADTRPGEIEGEIHDAKTGEPLPGVTIVVTRDADVRGTQISDAEGYFRVRGLAPDRYRLELYYGDETLHITDVVVDRGQTATADWKLEQTAAGDVVRATWHPSPPKPHHAPRMSAGHGAIVGVVTTKHDRSPLRGLGIVIRRGDGLKAAVTSDHRGDFFFDDLVPGDYTAVFDAPAGATGALGTLHVTAGQITSADLTIELPD
ncbi:MAG: carboxypeptidase regulatory-like domain-containing protein [Acidobacteriota bacterium]